MGLRRWFFGTFRADSVETESLSAEEGVVTGETLVETSRSSNSPSTSSGSLINIYDGENRDRNDEFDGDGNARFVPSKTGEYFVDIGADIRGSTVEGDSIELRIQNLTDGEIVNRVEIQATDAVFAAHALFQATLTAGKNYELQVANKNSSFVVQSNDTTTGKILWSVAQ